MPDMEQNPYRARRAILAVAVVAVLAGVDLVREARIGEVLAQGSGAEAVPEAKAPASREPTFEEELERLHPGRQSAANMCRAGSGSGSGGCCCNGRAGSGSGSSSGFNRNQCGACGGRTGQ